MDEIDKLPGIKDEDLAKLGPCQVCSRPLIEPGRQARLTFYRISVERAAFIPRNIERNVGLTMMLGGHVGIARAMGGDLDIAKIFDGPHVVVVHEECASRPGPIFNLIPEKKEPTTDADKT